MASCRYVVLVAATCLAISSIQVISGAEDMTRACCLSGCARTYIPYFKRLVASQLGVTMTESRMSLYAASNQCWDCDLLHRVWHAVASATGGSRRRRHIYGFERFPSRQFQTPISYIFNDTVPNDIDARGTVRNALAHIAARTCIRFTEISQPSTSSHISFGQGSSSVAFVGRTLDTASSPIFVTRSYFTQMGELMYLVAQNLGLWHVTQRPDRDDYVRVVTENLVESYKADLFKLSESSGLLETFGLPYDYASLMHFPAKVYSANGQNTIEPKNGLYTKTLGQRVQLSFIDAKLLNLAYCTGSCSGRALPRQCQNGGYQDPNNCNRCLCPDGFGGTYCTDLESAQGASCGGYRTATAMQQSIKSPGYDSPRYYNSLLKCAWRIQAPTGQTIRLRLLDDFGLYCKNSACYDWLEIRYTGLLNNTGPRFCCSTRPAVDLTSSSNEALVIFQSNMTGISAAQRRGFHLVYSLAGQTQVTTPSTGVCNPNPCRNHGRCVTNTSSPTGYSCVCARGLSGPLCEQGCCGGCNARPGMTVWPCVAEEYPRRMCNVTRWYHGWGRRGPRHGPYGTYGRGPYGWGQRTYQVPCTYKFCCDNAKRVGVPNVTHQCAVEGWTNWTRCSASCGGGRRHRVLYEIQSQTYWSRTYVTPVGVNRTSELCSTNICNCPSTPSPTSSPSPRYTSPSPLYGPVPAHWRPRWYPWRRWWRCNACNYRFQQQGTQCVPASTSTTTP